MDAQELIEQEGRARRLSERTIESYKFCVGKFFEWCKKEPRKITKQDIKDFVGYLNSRERAGNTINVYVNALRFFLQEVLAKRVVWRIRYAKTPKTMPVVLTKQEVRRLIDTIENRKHKILIEILYSAGLRVSELTNLKVEDLEIGQGIGWVRKGKGRKDRVFIIAKNLIPKIKEYLAENCIAEGYIFTGKRGKISTRTIQEIIKKATKKAGIKKNVHPHTLRHSFATHLVENGYDVSTVQTLLGHNSMQTTMVYVHMASPKLVNVRSPYDNEE